MGGLSPDGVRKMKAEHASRIVVKVGTSTITHENGQPNIRCIEHLCRVLADLTNSGRQVVLVTSGAIGVGMGRVGLTERPTDTAGRQAMAAVGQCELMSMYDRFFTEYGRNCAQVLLTGDIIDDEGRKTCVVNCINALLSLGIIPVINENDAVSVVELEGHNIGDNDNLSSIVARLIGAEALVLMTDTDGLYDRDPHASDEAVQIPVVLEITDHIRAIAGGRGSKRGTGGMATKLAAAEQACCAGIDAYILSGSEPEALYDLMDGRSVGTHFVPPVAE